MSKNGVLGWLSVVLFIIALSILAFVGILLLFPALQNFIHVNAQVLFIVSDVLALAAVVLGFLARNIPGRVGGIGGLVVFIPLTILLSFTIIARVQTHVLGF